MNSRILCQCVGGCLTLAGLAAAGEDGSTSNQAPPAAVVESRVKESDLTRVVLSTDAERRLAIATTKVEVESIEPSRLMKGVVEIPPDREATLIAPLAGTVVGFGEAPAGAERSVSVGAEVKAGQVLAILRVGAEIGGAALTPADRIATARAIADLEALRAEARTRVREETARVASAKIELDRAEALAKDQVGSMSEVDRVRAIYDVARAALEGEQQRDAKLEEAQQTIGAGGSFDLEIRSPLDGELRSRSVHRGQPVVAGTIVAVVGALDVLWVRVPLRASELAGFHDVETARVARGTIADAVMAPARHVLAPRSGRADIAARELVLEVDANSLTPPIAPGERLIVRIARSPSKSVDSAKRLKVPRSAIVRDLSGGEWVYTKVAERTSARRRITVVDMVGDDAIIGLGLGAGVEVVAAGAAELFGVEFGAGK